MSKLPPTVRSACRFFVFSLANGTVDVELLGDIDYRPHVVEFGSELEQVVAIFLKSSNWTRTTSRLIRPPPSGERPNGCKYNDPSYVVDPPFEDWELELHGP